MSNKLRGLLEPYKVLYEYKNDKQRSGTLVLEPFERGFGITIANSLRRVLLSSIEGAAISCVKIAGVDHEFSAIHGIMEDVLDIICNIRSLRFQMSFDDPVVAKISFAGPGIVTGANLDLPRGVTCLTPNVHICEISDNVTFEASVLIKVGRGYCESTSAQEEQDSKYLGSHGRGCCIGVTANYSPIQSVAFDIENIRVGGSQDCERILLYVETDGSIDPSKAMQKAADILIAQLSRITSNVQSSNIAESQNKSEKSAVIVSAEEELCEKLMKNIDDLELTVRSQNCLKNFGITTVWALIQMNHADLLKIDNFGKKSLTEINDVLVRMNLSLGANIPLRVVELMSNRMNDVLVKDSDK